MLYDRLYNIVADRDLRFEVVSEPRTEATIELPFDLDALRETLDEMNAVTDQVSNVLNAMLEGDCSESTMNALDQVIAEMGRVNTDLFNHISTEAEDGE